MSKTLNELNAIIDRINELKEDSDILDILGAFKGLEYTASRLNYELMERYCLRVKEGK